MSWNQYHHTSSQGSSEASVLQKLAFEEKGGDDLVFAKCVNRVRNNAAYLLPLFVEIFMFFQAIGLAFLTNHESMFDSVSYLQAFGVLLRVFVDWGSLVPAAHEPTFNMAFTIILMVLVFGWLITYLAFMAHYSKHKTFSPFVAKFLYLVGYYLARLLTVIGGTTFGYCMRSLFFDIEISSLLALAAIFVFLIVVWVTDMMIRAVHSSPNINMKDPVCMWPQDRLFLQYRNIGALLIALIISIIKPAPHMPPWVPHLLVIALAVGGIIIIQVNHDMFLFPKGNSIATTQFLIMMYGGLVSVVYHFVGGHPLIYLGVFLLLVIVSALIVHFVVRKKFRTRVDYMYSTYRDFQDVIFTPKECISFIKTGLVFNCPCVFVNQPLLNWAVARWPDDQKLLLMCAYVRYILNTQNREIMELVTMAVDIHPLDYYSNLLFGQIFAFLPVREHSLKKNLEGVKRLYDLPKADLKNFWSAVLIRQWDEIIMHAESWEKDVNHIGEIFDHLIFENPASDVVLGEYVTYCNEVKVNYGLGAAADAELQNRKEVDLENQLEETPAEIDEGSHLSQQMSKLDSHKSSVFLKSQVSQTQNFIVDKAQYNIQQAVLARHIFWPEKFFITILGLSLISLVSVIVVFAITENYTTRLDRQISLCGYLHQISHILTVIMTVTMEFSSWGSSSSTTTGKPFDEEAMRTTLNNRCNTLDEYIVAALDLHRYMPREVMHKWVSSYVQPLTPSPVTPWPTNVSFIHAIRLFHLKARTVAFTPKDYIGSTTNPNSEIESVSYLYAATVEAMTELTLNACATIEEERRPNFLIVILTSCGCLLLTIVSMVIGCVTVVIGIKKEFEFILSLYGSISPRVVRNIFSEDGDAITASEEKRDMAILSGQGNQSRRNLPWKYYKLWGVISLFVLVALVTAIPVVMIVVRYVVYQSEMGYVENGFKKTIQLVEALGHVCLYSFRFVSGFPSELSGEAEIEQANQQVNNLVRVYSELYFGATKDFPDGLILQDDTIGTKTCNEVLPGKGLNESCFNFHEDVFQLSNLVKRLKSRGLTNGTDMGGLDSNWWADFYEPTQYCLNYGVEGFYQLFVKVAYSERDLTQIILIVGLVVGILLFICDIVASWRFRRDELETGMWSLIKPITILTPDVLVDAPYILRFLQGDFDDEDRTAAMDGNGSDSENKPLVDYIVEGVLVMTPDGTIIASNRKYHEMMQTTPEETLGVNVKTILPASLAPLYEAMEHPKTRGGTQAQTQLSVDVVLFGEDSKEMNVKVSFVAEWEIKSRGTLSAFIISDRSELIRTQNLLRKEKQNVEELLDSILPHNIAVSLLNGQSEISFEVPKACVLFSDIVSFTPMCSNMTAKQVMNMLNRLFTEFDTELGNFRRVTKLKTIGDAYVCAAGIFEGEGPIEEAAAEIVTYGFKMQDIIPQVNKQLGTQMHMRIGIHTGGPLICGVLGKEKPLFEVIGTTVNLAEDLEAAGVPDKLHVAKSTIDLIQDLKIKAIERDDVHISGIDGPTYTLSL